MIIDATALFTAAREARFARAQRQSLLHRAMPDDGNHVTAHARQQLVLPVALRRTPRRGHGRPHEPHHTRID